MGARKYPRRRRKCRRHIASRTLAATLYARRSRRLRRASESDSAMCRGGLTVRSNISQQRPADPHYAAGCHESRFGVRLRGMKWGSGDCVIRPLNAPVNYSPRVYPRARYLPTNSLKLCARSKALPRLVAEMERPFLKPIGHLTLSSARFSLPSTYGLASNATRATRGKAVVTGLGTARSRDRRRQVTA